MSFLRSLDLKSFAVLQLMILLNSLGGICSKLAGREVFLSARFILLYGGLLMILFVYAIGWQQIIKRMPLTTAYANKAVGIFWTILWGVMLFNEKLTFRMIIGVFVVLCGVMIVVKADE